MVNSFISARKLPPWINSRWPGLSTFSAFGCTFMAYIRYYGECTSNQRVEAFPVQLIYLFMSGVDWMPVYDAYIESFDQHSFAKLFPG